MRIGIMTFWWSEDNYGQLLQCYALQKYLRDAGHDAYLIRYRNMERSPLWKRVLKGLNPYLVYKHIKYKIKTTKVVQEQTANSRHFDGFRDKYIRQSQRLYYSYKELQENPPEADVYVVGSDQVWNFSFYGSDLKYRLPVVHAYFLDFGPPEVKRMSYAASWSVASLDGRLAAEIEPLLSRFDFVSVREEQGVGLCRRCGCENARWVCDPTLLLPAEKYRSLYRVEGGQPPVSGKYLFLYMLANSHRFDIQGVYDFAQRRGLQVVYVTGNGVLDKREKCFATIPQWLSLVDNAECVVTNSFHCCVFSVLFQKRFAVVPLSGSYRGMNSRMESLFSQFGMEARWLGEDFSVLERECNSTLRDMSECSGFFIDKITPPPHICRVAISVIVPVYRAEQYLSRCVNSLLGQTFMNFELILIDDGSPDACGELCDHYAVLDSRVQVIHQENKGAAGARNTGLQKARGKYLVCVDSDDWVEPDYLECLYNEAERSGADVVGCNLVREQGKKAVERRNQLPACPADCIRGLLEGRVQGWLPVKFLRRSLVVEHGISFVEGLDLWEDVLFSVRIFAFAKTVSNVDKVLYHYRDTPSSIVNSIDERRIREMLGITYLIEDFLSSHGLSGEFGCLVPVVQARVKLFTVFSPDKQVRRAFRNEMKWTDSLLYKRPVSMAGKICIFCYLHNIFWGQTLLITTRQLLKKLIAFMTRKM